MEKKKSQRQTRVKVAIRVRPPLQADSKICVESRKNKVEISNHRNVNETLQYEFSSVFDKSSTQKEVFDKCVKPLLGHASKGENVSIFAYGPTGAGKTYTMLGTETDPGMIPRVIHALFKSMAPRPPSVSVPQSVGEGEPLPPAPAPAPPPPSEHKVYFSFLEIYNEKVQDLLNPSETDLPIREDGNHKIFVAGLTEKQIKSFADFKNLFGPASKNRTMGATLLNDRSSRSHCIVQLRVDTRVDKKLFRGKVYLIDLAGSEDNRRTGNSGIRLKESGAINKSLFALGEVVDAINQNLPRIPYRNSKLTRLLQDSIGGTCHSVMITNVAPEQSFYYDTYCTLNFATKSRKIVNSNIADISSLQQPKPRSLRWVNSDSSVGEQKTLKRVNSDSTFGDGAAKRAKAEVSPLGSVVNVVKTMPLRITLWFMVCTWVVRVLLGF